MNAMVGGWKIILAKMGVSAIFLAELK